MRHAHAVNFIQNVVGQKIFLIEPEVAAKSVACASERFAQCLQSTSSASLEVGAASKACFCASENVPFQ